MTFSLYKFQLPKDKGESRTYYLITRRKKPDKYKTLIEITLHQTLLNVSSVFSQISYQHFNKSYNSEISLKLFQYRTDEVHLV